MANTITLFRMAAGIVLLLCPVFSPAFFVLYIAAGLSDMLDGFVARKTDTVSELGARLDTMADFVLVVVCLIKLLPILRIPAWLYGWIGIIAFIKVANIISGFTAQKKLVTVHSVMNKATGALLFLMPLTIPAVPLKYSAIVVCAVATCRYSGRPIHQNRKRIAARAMQSLDWEEKKTMEFKGTLIVVKDCNKALKFYQDMFGFELIRDNDGNLELSGNLYLQEEKYWERFTGRRVIPQSNQTELYFEESEIDSFVKKLETLYPDTEYVNHLMTHSWGQRVVRFYDPDGNLIEVGTPV